jgi:hypothetical protein
MALWLGSLRRDPRLWVLLHQPYLLPRHLRHLPVYHSTQLISPISQFDDCVDCLHVIIRSGTVNS